MVRPLTVVLVTVCAAKSPREMFTQLLSQPPVALNKARPGTTYGSSVEAVVMRGLSKDPKARYASVVDFARELSTVLVADGTPSTVDPGLFSRMKGLFKGKT